MSNALCVLEQYEKICKKLMRCDGSLDKMYLYEGFIQNSYLRRPYHNFDHIMSGLNIISNQRFLDFDYSKELKLAWILHDVITNCRQAELMCTFFAQRLIYDIGLWLNEEVVYDLILETQIDVGLVDGPSTTGLYEADLIHDVDFMGLGKDWETFLKHDNNIIREYGKRFSPQKRKEFFESVRNMDNIFRIDKFRDEFEVQARLNIKKILSVERKKLLLR